MILLSGIDRSYLILGVVTGLRVTAPKFQSPGEVRWGEVGGECGPFRSIALLSVGAVSGVGGLASGFAGFQCKCQNGNCLLELKGSQLRAAYATTHPQGGGTSPSKVNEQVHRLLWQMKEALPLPNNRGHNYRISSFSYDKTPLCKRGWEALMGATGWGMRTSLGLVLRGVSQAKQAPLCLSQLSNVWRQRPPRSGG